MATVKTVFISFSILLTATRANWPTPKPPTPKPVSIPTPQPTPVPTNAFRSMYCEYNIAGLVSDPKTADTKASVNSDSTTNPSANECISLNVLRVQYCWTGLRPQNRRHQSQCQFRLHNQPQCQRMHFA